MPDVGTAYVQILPKAKGIKANIEKSMKGDAVSAGESTGSAMGGSLVSTLTGVVAAAGIGKAISSAITEGANLEQSFGGLDTIYGDASEAAKNYAAEAAKAGISANDYAEQAVSFGASLKQAFGGDTTQAVEAANTAILDMTDNAAKMGTDIESIQNAYAGFAKQNYTMLDNLKLGYGGTKTEMERLLADAQELTGVEYDIDNLGDVYEAIHVIQGELGLTGVAADEAATTISGSAGAMKAAFANVLGNLALGEDIRPALDGLLEATDTFIFDNLLPAFGNIVTALPEVFSGILDHVPDILTSVQGVIDPIITMIMETDWLGMISGVIETILTAITENAPSMLEGGVELITNLANGMLENAPSVITGIGGIISQVLSFIVTNLPTFLQKGIELIGNIATGIWNNLPAIISAIAGVVSQIISDLAASLPDMLSKGMEILSNVANGILNNLPEILSAAAEALAEFLTGVGNALPDVLAKGGEIIAQLVEGIVSAIGSVASAAGQVISSAVNAFSQYDWASIGSNIVSGIVSGITSAAGALWSSLSQLASDALAAAKSKLEISSPSKVFAREVGRYIPEGIALGIEQEDAPVVAINRQVNAMVDAGRLAKNANYGGGTAYDYGGVTINVYAAKGQSAEEIANEVSRRINNSINRKKAVWA